MAEEEEFISYKDISELKNQLDAMKGKKEVPKEELYAVVQKLAETMADMLEVFGAAAEQMKLEDKEYEANTIKHEQITSKLDKIMDQNKTIAEAMVGVVDMIKEGMVEPEKEESLFKPEEEPVFRPRPEPKPAPEPRQFMQPSPPNWQPKIEPMMLSRPEPVQRPQPMMSPQPLPPPPISSPFQPPSMQSPFPPPPDFGVQMPPMEPTPMPDLEVPEAPEPLEFEEEPKKKGIFGMFKK